MASIIFTEKQFLDLDWSQIIDLIDVGITEIKFPRSATTENHASDLRYWIDPANADDPMVKKEFQNRFSMEIIDGEQYRKSVMHISK